MLVHHDPVRFPTQQDGDEKVLVLNDPVIALTACEPPWKLRAEIPSSCYLGHICLVNHYASLREV